jgi:hypothetical protein
MNSPVDLTKERAAELLSYDPETGAFTWRIKKGTSKAGAPAGYQNPRGYLMITIDRRLYRAHRIAFLIMTGSWPVFGVDHINGIKNDNRWRNLRDVPDEVNIQNKHHPKGGRKNCALPLGVSLSPKSSIRPYRAKIQVGGKTIHLGSFPTPNEAHDAYLTAKRTHHEGCTI